MTVRVPSADDNALIRYSVTPSDLDQVRQQLGQNPACTDQLVRQFIQATGGDVPLVGQIAGCIRHHKHYSTPFSIPRISFAGSQEVDSHP